MNSIASLNETLESVGNRSIQGNGAFGACDQKRAEQAREAAGIAEAVTPPCAGAGNVFFGTQERMNPAGSRPSFHQPRWLPSQGTRLWVALTVIALLAGIGLRVVRLDRVPPGLDQDEACNGYDAYSILETGRDQHGNLMPLAIQAFNDYRMPLFDYSLVPLVAAFGLRPVSVRLGAAMWGAVDMAAIVFIAGLLLGWPGAAIAALLTAFSPWHLFYSRFAHEAITSSATIDLAMAAFFLWVTRRGDRWLLLSALFFGLSLYAYSITKLFAPLMIGWLVLLYWRELRQAGHEALAALGMVGLFAVPQAVLIGLHPEMMVRYRTTSVLHRAGSLAIGLQAVAAGWASYFTPSYLFTAGDVSVFNHVQHFGQLLPVQAPLIALAAIGLFAAPYRKLIVLLTGWLMLAALPAALLKDSPSALHGVLASEPWTLLSASGFTTLLDLVAGIPVVTACAAVLIPAWVVFSGVQFVRSYFVDYPIAAARNFQYGLEEVVRSLGGLGDENEPVVFPLDDINQPYIYVLFFMHYPPARFQRGPVVRTHGIMAPVLRFDRYIFYYPGLAYQNLEHGIFVFPSWASPPAEPVLTVRYPDGTAAYSVVVK